MSRKTAAARSAPCRPLSRAVRLIVAALPLGAGFFAAGPGLTPPPALAEMHSVSDNAWTEKLPGGPEVLFLPQRSVPMFSCTVLVPAGSALETPATNGAAHYLEHLLFNGTTSRTREQLYAETDLLGAYNNASTQRERTVFQLLLPSENWREGLALQADMLRNSTLPEAMFDKERGIILEELAKDRSIPEWSAARFVDEALWGDSSRGLAVLGTEESIAGMDPAAVTAFYHGGYRPRGMTVVLMGDFDLAEARDELTRLYGNDERPVSVMPARPPFPEGRRVVGRKFDGLGGVEIRVMLPLPPLAGDDFATARLVESMLSSGEGTALARAVEAASASPMSAAVSIDGGSPWSLLTLAAELPEGADPAPVISALLAHAAAFAEFGPDAAHLETSRREVVAGEISLREKMHYYGLMRADALGTAGPAVAATLAERAAERTAADCAALVGQALSDGRVLVTVAGASKDFDRDLSEQPSAEDAAWWPAPEDDVAAPPAPVAPPVTTETVILRDELPGGTVLVVHSSPDSRTFAAHVVLRRAGLEAALDVPRGTTDIVHRMMSQGTESLSEDELRGQLARLGAKLKTTDLDWIPYDDYYFSPEYSYLRLETIDLYALESLGLLAEVMRSPRLDEEALAKARTAAVARAEKDGRSPRTVADRLFWKAAGHPDLGAVYGNPEALRGTTLDDVKRAHAALLKPWRRIIVVSGSLPADTLRAEATRLFAFEAPTTDYRGDEENTLSGGLDYARLEEETGQEQSWLLIGSRIGAAHAAAPPDDEPALRLAAAILSDRLADRLREKEGLAYSIGASYRTSPPRVVRMSAGTRPANLERMEEGMLEVAASLVSEPPSAADVAGAFNRGEGRGRMRRLSRIGQAYALAMAELRGRDPRHLDAGLPALRAVTPEDVVAAARAHLAFDAPITTIAR